MCRLYLFAEGQTEQTFARTVIAPHLAMFGVYLQHAVLVANHKEKGRTHRGGGRHYLPMKNDLLKFLRQESGGDVFFTTMIDLYALYSDFPGMEQASSLQAYPGRRVGALEQAFASDIGDARFIPHLQLHEYEACLLVDPAQFALFYDHAATGIERLTQLVNNYSSPELVNDGPETAPSKRIIREFPQYSRGKTIVGPQMAELIGMPAIRSKCPHFDAWITKLEQLKPISHSRM